MFLLVGKPKGKPTDKSFGRAHQGTHSGIVGSHELLEIGVEVLKGLSPPPPFKHHTGGNSHQRGSYGPSWPSKRRGSPASRPSACRSSREARFERRSRRAGEAQAAAAAAKAAGVTAAERPRPAGSAVLGRAAPAEVSEVGGRPWRSVTGMGCPRLISTRLRHQIACCHFYLDVSQNGFRNP